MDVIGMCNMALSFVGGNSIVSLTDDTIEAEECNRFYDIARTYCLENRDWTFAASTRQLAKDATPASTEFANSFSLPSDCLVVREVSDSADLRSRIKYQKNGNTIVTDESTVYVKYTKNITNTSLFSPSFQTAVAHKLGEFLSPKITGDKVLKQTLQQNSEDLLDSGGAIDGMQGSPKRAFASKLLNARFGGTARYGLGSKLY